MNAKLPLKGTAYVYRSDIWDGRGQGGVLLTQRKQNTQSPRQPLRGFTEYGMTWIAFHIIFPQQKLTGDPVGRL